MSVDSVVKTVSYEDMLKDLNSIPINKSDILFEIFSTKSSQETNDDDNVPDVNELNSKLEKYILFKTNQMASESFDKPNDTSSLDRLNDEFDSLEKRLNSLQHFVDVSKKFFNQ